MQDTSGVGITSANLDTYKNWVDGACEYNRAINISDHGPNIEADALTELVEYCQGKGMEIITMKEFYRKYGKYVTGTGNGIPGTLEDKINV